MKNFAKLLLGNGGKYFVGDDLTWADIRYVFTLNDNINNFGHKHFKQKFYQ